MWHITQPDQLDAKYAPDQWVVLRDASSKWALPGGKRLRLSREQVSRHQDCNYCPVLQQLQVQSAALDHTVNVSGPDGSPAAQQSQ